MNFNFKKIFICVSLLFFTVCVFAKDVTIQVVQHGGSPETVSETTLMLEDELLNSFFDRGHIVSNLPAVMSQSSDEDKDLIEKLFSESATGGGDYAVQVRIYLDTSNSSNPKAVLLSDIKKVEWDGAVVKSRKGASGSMQGPDAQQQNKLDNMHKYIATVVNNILKTLEI